jgi:putative alpha-1,2-mannosidase
VPRAVIAVAAGKTFTMEARGLSATNRYIQSAKLNGRPHDVSFVRHEDVMKGGTLVFVMGAKPDHKWASSPSAAPYSMSR